MLQRKGRTVKTMTSRQRLLAAYARQPVDRIPCSPRVWAWMREFYGDARPETLLRMAREFGFDPHFAVGVFPQPVGLTPTVDYYLPGVRAAAVEEGFDGDLRVVRRIFEVPAGTFTNVTKIPPRETGLFLGKSEPGNPGTGSFESGDGSFEFGDELSGSGRAVPMKPACHSLCLKCLSLPLPHAGLHERFSGAAARFRTKENWVPWIFSNGSPG